MIIFRVLLSLSLLTLVSCGVGGVTTVADPAPVKSAVDEYEKKVQEQLDSMTPGERAKQSEFTNAMECYLKVKGCDMDCFWVRKVEEGGTLGKLMKVGETGFAVLSKVQEFALKLIPTATKLVTKFAMMSIGPIADSEKELINVSADATGVVTDLTAEVSKWGMTAIAKLPGDMCKKCTSSKCDPDGSIPFFHPIAGNDTDDLFENAS